MRKSWALQALSAVAIAAAGVAWAADDGAGSGQSTQKNTAPNADSSNGLRLDPKIDRLPAKRGKHDNDASRQGSGNETDNGSSDMMAPPNPASPPTTLFPAHPKPPADPGKPGNPVTPTSARS